jgi:hypothetical protein
MDKMLMASFLPSLAAVYLTFYPTSKLKKLHLKKGDSFGKTIF